MSLYIHPVQSLYKIEAHDPCTVTWEVIHIALLWHKWLGVSPFPVEKTCLWNINALEKLEKAFWFCIVLPYKASVLLPIRFTCVFSLLMPVYNAVRWRDDQTAGFSDGLMFWASLHWCDDRICICTDRHWWISVSRSMYAVKAASKWIGAGLRST